MHACSVPLYVAVCNTTQHVERRLYLTAYYCYAHPDEQARLRVRHDSVWQKLHTITVRDAAALKLVDDVTAACQSPHACPANGLSHTRRVEHDGQCQCLYPPPKRSTSIILFALYGLSRNAHPFDRHRTVDMTALQYAYIRTCSIQRQRRMLTQIRPLELLRHAGYHLALQTSVGHVSVSGRRAVLVREELVANIIDLGNLLGMSKGITCMTRKSFYGRNTKQWIF